MAVRKKYVDNAQLLEEIRATQKHGKISDELHLMFWKMCNKIINRPRFSRYTDEWKEDMISTAYVKCLGTICKFSPDRTNPFSYYTTVITNCFLDCLNAEKKQKNIKDRMKEIYIGAMA
jgi:DNA-directed RNA polymerase specialized sigma24 family protein